MEDPLGAVPVQVHYPLFFGGGIFLEGGREGGREGGVSGELCQYRCTTRFSSNEEEFFCREGGREGGREGVVSGKTEDE